MKNIIECIIEEYLQLFPEEKNRMMHLQEYLKKHNNIQLTDWNNFDGHIVASGFVYALEEKKFLVMYHKDMKMYTYPGGHMEKADKNPLESAKREVIEETGLKNIVEFKVADNQIIPIDIDTHKIAYNERLHLPEHYHFDFRYLFFIKNIESISIDTSELSNFKWITIDELRDNPDFGTIADKFRDVLS